MHLYDHLLAEPLDRRGMQALFAVAVKEPMTDRARAQAYEWWCSRLHRRAAAARIVWLPASGNAMTLVDVPTKKLEQMLLRIVGEIPVFPGSVREEQPKE